MSVHTRREGAALIVEMDNPPVNAIGQAMRAGLLAAVAEAEAGAGVSRVVLTGRGRAFAAGADAREFDTGPLAPHLPDVCDAIEGCAVPWLAAIGGVALGGGCELALACRYRVAAPAAQIGLPEVTLGVVPGAGGTQRLPRVVGLAPALSMIATGKPVRAAEAAAMGLVDAVADDPLQAALDLEADSLARATVTSDRPAPEPDPEAVAAASVEATRKNAGQIAPLRAIELVVAATEMPLREALALERETFLRLKEGEQARALRHVFFAERAAKAPGWLRAEPAAIERIAVVGGGTMGAGIAYAALNAGLQVTLLETDAEGAARARERIERLLGEGVRRGLFDEQGAADRRTRLQATQDYAAASGCGLAIEAAFESMPVKAEVFARLEAALPGDAVLATNTSYLDIDAIAAGLADPARVLGLHFFAPAHVMKLLEVVRARHSSDRALATGFALGKRLRKVPVLAGVCDGFIGNRILKRYREAADVLLLDGATPWEIDAAMVDFGYSMGPYAAQDLSGLDIAHAQRRREDATRDPNRRYVPIADRLVQQGRLGRKTGAGWYRYPDGAEMQTDSAVEEIVREEARSAGVARRAFTAEEIRNRLLCAMINEAAFILEEGIAQSARDIDLVTVFGYGFPRWRGGLMFFADGWGAAEIAERLRLYAAEDPVMWTAAPLLLERAETGRRLAEIGE